MGQKGNIRYFSIFFAPWNYVSIHVRSKVWIALFMGGAKYEGSKKLRIKFAKYIYKAFILCSAHKKSDTDFALHMKKRTYF